MVPEYKDQIKNEMTVHIAQLTKQVRIYAKQEKTILLSIIFLKLYLHINGSRIRMTVKVTHRGLNMSVKVRKVRIL